MYPMIDPALADAGLGDAEDDDFDAIEAPDALLPDHRYLDRELSWLAFNQRVLELAEDPSLPELERANFLAIFASNLDEFFMVRVAGLKRRIVTGLAVPTNIGRSPADALADIAREAHALQLRHADAWTSLVRPALADVRHRDHRSGPSSPSEERGTLCRSTSGAQVFPVLMPLAVDPAHPFPYISGLSLNLAIRIRNARTGRQEFARLKVPPMLPRFVEVPGSGEIKSASSRLEELIANHLGDLFPGMEVLDHHAFRLTRNEDVEIEEDESENLIQALEAELLRRRFGPPIRLEITDDMDEVTMDLLVQELDITDQEIYRLPGPLDLRGPVRRCRASIAPTCATRRTCRPPPSRSSRRGSNTRADIFKAIRKSDVLVHHPYESFTTSVQAVPRAGRPRPARARHQADAVPHLGRQPDRAGADRRRRGRQAGARAGRGQGAIRRGEQHRLGAQAREGRRARGLRPRRSEDPLQARARDPRGRRQAAPLLARRHRQLQPEDQPHLRGLRPVHRRRAGRQGPHPSVQRAQRLRDREEVQAPARRPAAPAQGPGAPDRRGAAERRGRQARAASASR